MKRPIVPLATVIFGLTLSLSCIGCSQPPPIKTEPPIKVVVVSDSRKGDELLLRLRNNGPFQPPVAIMIKQDGKTWRFKRHFEANEDITLYLPIPGHDPGKPIISEIVSLQTIPFSEISTLSLPRAHDIHSLQGEKK